MRLSDPEIVGFVNIGPIIYERGDHGAVKDRYGVDANIANAFFKMEDIVTDHTPPVIGFSSLPPLGGSHNAQNPLIVGGTCDSTAQPLEVTLYHKEAPDHVLSSLWGSTSCTEFGGEGVWLAAFDPSSLSDGPVVIRAFQRDLAENETTEELEITKDTQVPILSINALDTTSNGITSSAYTVSGACDEENAEVQVTIRGPGGNEVSSSAPVNCLAGGTWSGEFDISSLDDGPLSVRAFYEDSGGNKGVATPVSF